MLSWPRSRWRAPRSPRRTARTAGGDVSLLQHRVWSPQHYVGRFQGAFPAAPPDSLRGDRNGADMQRWRGYDAVPAGWGRSVVTIGVFDGVHRGHQQIIGHAVKRAGDLGLGADALCVIPFTAEFSRLSPEAFAHDVLVEQLNAALVTVGENFRFGHRAAGDVDLLRRLGRTFGFGVEVPPLVADGETIFSSTYIRTCVHAGDVAAAAGALGRPHRLEGVVVRGDRRGKEIGFPTANLLTRPDAAVPADGVYAAWLVRDVQRLPAAVSIGTNPTFSGRERRVEAYVLDFDDDLYGERVALDFVERLRDMQRYSGVEPLIAQIREDIVRTREVLSL